eukprot:TRINITY_DN4788_c0_g1_i8.p2 TRINITY_DN4788_c0_g1~~TRINITY_DN4788_c0_g1_i8.p2  ORF type:complete len:125 (+),score=0.36 TRINITY_DN4788_c0_g1_i8:480-854(+)
MFYFHDEEAILTHNFTCKLVNGKYFLNALASVHKCMQTYFPCVKFSQSISNDLFVGNIFTFCLFGMVFDTIFEFWRYILSVQLLLQILEMFAIMFYQYQLDGTLTFWSPAPIVQLQKNQYSIQF